MKTAKSIVVGNVEEFTSDYIYDSKRDSILINIEDEYTRGIKSRLLELGYDMILQRYHEDSDTMTLVFVRW